MSTVSGHFTVRGIDLDVTYKDIKHLHIGVHPPAGSVRVAAPTRLDDDQVRLAVIQRLSWIKRQREKLRLVERQTEREMVAGESHCVWGVPRRLKVVERPGRAHIEADGERLELYVPADTPAEKRREHLDQWYRDQLREVILGLIAKWETMLDVTVPKWTIRRIKTKWGSCNRETRHIWLNVELAKKHSDCLKYIVVHEMTHYFERNHGGRFIALMDKHLPNWRSRLQQLNAAPLASEDWTNAG